MATGASACLLALGLIASTPVMQTSAAPASAPEALRRSLAGAFSEGGSEPREPPSRLRATAPKAEWGGVGTALARRSLGEGGSERVGGSGPPPPRSGFGEVSPERAFGAKADGAKPPGQETTFPAPRDVETFRKNIEPLLTRDRGGSMPGYAACVMCHTWQTSLRFRLEIPTTDAGWTPDQSRRNLEMLTKVVNTSSPENSRLLLKPLDPAAGGLGHTGGTYWTSREDPEYQVVLKWIRSLPAGRYAPPRDDPIDFEFFRSCVQKVFQNPREGHIKCSNCHAAGMMGFAPVPAEGRNEWNELEARDAFQVIMRLVVPGNPEESRFLLKPLHPDGGGSYVHNGPRRWQSRDDPEWQMLASWVRGERKGNSCQ